MYDIIVIGAGPAGLTAAIYARRADKNVLVLSTGSQGEPRSALSRLANGEFSRVEIDSYTCGKKSNESGKVKLASCTLDFKKSIHDVDGS